MTIHKSQGTQFDAGRRAAARRRSRLLTRELFYTAVTRAQQRVRVVGPEAGPCRRRDRGPSGRPACGCASAGGDAALSSGPDTCRRATGIA